MTSPKVWSKGTCSNRGRRIVRDTSDNRKGTGQGTGQAQSGNCFCCGKTGQKNATDADKRRQSVIPAGGKIISIPCVAAQAHKDTNVLTDMYTRWMMISQRALMVRMSMNCSQLTPRRRCAGKVQWPRSDPSIASCKRGGP